MEESTWIIKTFETTNGDNPIEGFIISQQPQTQSKITHLLDLLEKHGPLLGMPYTKKIAQNLYELRIRGREEVRILFTYKERNIYLLHGFKKKTQKTPAKEIEIALKRLELL